MYYYILGYKTGDFDYDEKVTLLHDKKYTDDEFRIMVELSWDNCNKLAGRELCWQDAISLVWSELMWLYGFQPYAVQKVGSKYNAFPKATKP